MMITLQCSFLFLYAPDAKKVEYFLIFYKQKCPNFPLSYGHDLMLKRDDFSREKKRRQGCYICYDRSQDKHIAFIFSECSILQASHTFHKVNISLQYFLNSAFLWKIKDGTTTVRINGGIVSPFSKSKVFKDCSLSDVKVIGMTTIRSTEMPPIIMRLAMLTTSWLCDKMFMEFRLLSFWGIGTKSSLSDWKDL